MGAQDHPSPSDDVLGRVLEIVELLARKSASGNYIYRGEHKRFDKVSSGLYRQYGEIEAGGVDVEVVQREILNEAKKYTTEIDEFEILTELQHFGGKTNLIDFTTDCLTALFFACDGFPDEDGRVVLLRESREGGGYTVRRPSNPANRVLAQKSMFVRPSRGFVEPDDSVDIRSNLKQPTLDYLRTSHGISTETIYNDLHGFIRVQDLHQSAYVEFHKGLTRQDKEDYEQAVSHYSKSIMLNPQLSVAYYNRGHAYHDKRDLDHAIQDYTKVLELEPNSVDAYMNRGNAYDDKWDRFRAIQDYSKVLELSPDLTFAYYNRGKAHFEEGDFDRSLQDINKALDLDPSFARAYLMRGTIRICLSEWANTRSDLTTARNKGIDIVAAFRDGYESVASFERKYGVELPEDIASMLA